MNENVKEYDDGSMDILKASCWMDGSMQLRTKTYSFDIFYHDQIQHYEDANPFNAASMYAMVHKELYYYCEGYNLEEGSNGVIPVHWAWITRKDDPLNVMDAVQQDPIPFYVGVQFPIELIHCWYFENNLPFRVFTNNVDMFDDLDSLPTHKTRHTHPFVGIKDTKIGGWYLSNMRNISPEDRKSPYFWSKNIKEIEGVSRKY